MTEEEGEKIRLEIEREIAEHAKHYMLRDREPVQVGFFEWAEWFNDYKARAVGDETIGSVRVTTAFMGYADIWFESMVFAATDHMHLHNMCRRYRRWAEAEVGHAELLALVRSQTQ